MFGHKTSAHEHKSVFRDYRVVLVKLLSIRISFYFRKYRFGWKVKMGQLRSSYVLIKQTRSPTRILRVQPRRAHIIQVLHPPKTVETASEVSVHHPVNILTEILIDLLYITDMKICCDFQCKYWP